MKSEVKTQSTCTTKEVVFDFAGGPVLGIEFRGHHKGGSGMLNWLLKGRRPTLDKPEIKGAALKKVN